VTLTLAAASPASSFAPIRANLDGDARLERIVARGTWGLRQWLVLEDVCRGRRAVYRLSGVRQTVDRVQVRELDGRTGRPEFFFDMRDGAGGHVGTAKVMRHTERPGRPCPQPRTLFRYRTERPSFPAPTGYGAVNFTVSFANFAKRHRGKEIRLWEGYVDRNDALCCPSKQRVTLLRYAPRRDRYVAYRTRVSRVNQD
jgi:hypothetical protein